MSTTPIVKYKTDEITALIEGILQEAKKQGATAAEVDVGLNKGFTVTARNKDVESVEYHQDKGIGITVYVGKRSGSTSLTDFQPEAVHSAVLAACNIARFTDEDPCSGLAEKELLAFNYPTLDLFYPWGISVEEAIKLAIECEIKALTKDKCIFSSEGVSITTVEASNFYANSEGFIGQYAGTRHDISCTLVAKQRDEMQRDYSYSAVCDPALLQSITEIADKAVERTVRRLGARPLKTQRIPVIFAAEEARTLLGHFIGAISGGNLYRKSSFLLDQLGQQIFPTHINMQEHPHLAKTLGSAPFDDNGVLTRDNIFIENGILKNYALGVYSARKLGMKTTGNAGGVHNLAISTGNKNLAELLKTMDKGLLVTEVMGQGVNLVTGDYSRGVAGFWIEHGEIQYPVEEITAAGNLRDIYANIVEIGNDIDRRGNIHTGSILIEEMMIAGH
jgi:PmbA protein